ncbi:hypothetical protein [Calothrix sp. NIES-3974]|nr:hypothetical protein [Calothrix sp. NIES-3974]BAZ04881.1 hypothetical protein NIES3974_15260 [Calothrix sp. NIES-3974]
MEINLQLNAHCLLAQNTELGVDLGNGSKLNYSVYTWLQLTVQLVNG